mgnify:CR=1 FL=1
MNNTLLPDVAVLSCPDGTRSKLAQIASWYLATMAAGSEP